MRAISYLSIIFLVGCAGTQETLRPRPQLSPPPVGFTLVWPVEHFHMTRGFDVSKKRPHLGLDLAGKKNSPIFAAHDGSVLYAGKGYKGYGKVIILEGPNSFATIYGHLTRFQVRAGAKVKKGQIIGNMGQTGHATGVHLHFELLREKTPVDPLLFLDQSKLY